MATSDPNLRSQIRAAVALTGPVKADSLKELKQALGLQSVSNTQFGRALRSLHYKHREVVLRRLPTDDPYFGRPYEVRA